MLPLGGAEARVAQFPRSKLLTEPGAYPGKVRDVDAPAARTESLLFPDCGVSIGLDCIQQLVERQRIETLDVVSWAGLPATSTLFTECAALAYVPRGTGEADRS